MLAILISNRHALMLQPQARQKEPAAADLLPLSVFDAAEQAQHPVDHLPEIFS